MMLKPSLRDERGATALEFAFAAPLLLIFLFVTFELGVVFFADAGLKSAIGEAARFSTLHPTPTDSQIKATFDQRKFGLTKGNLGAPQVTRGTTSDRAYVDISVSYSLTIDPLLIPAIPVTLVESRRAYIQAD